MDNGEQCVMTHSVKMNQTQFADNLAIPMQIYLTHKSLCKYIPSMLSEPWRNIYKSYSRSTAYS